MVLQGTKNLAQTEESSFWVGFVVFVATQKWPAETVGLPYKNTKAAKKAERRAGKASKKRQKIHSFFGYLSLENEH